MRAPKLGKPKELKHQDPNPCSVCSYCCEYVALEIDKPTTISDFDSIYWYLMHKHVWVFIDSENDWYIQFNSRCKKIKNRRCENYLHRPLMCREYEVEGCSRYGEGSDEKYVFKNADDFFLYLKRKRPAMYKKLKQKTHFKHQIQTKSCQKTCSKKCACS